MQQLAWVVSLTLMAAIAAVFVWVTAGAASKAQASERPFRGRGVLFGLALIAGIAIGYATLWPWPHVAHSATPAGADVVIDATGRQWAWELSQDTVEVGQVVQFHVTSADVNHGFAIYRNKTEIIAQTQAMPGYVNKLQVRFDEAGEYEVLCLEYCGLAHHSMIARIVVR